MNILTFDVEEWFHILDNDSTRTENEWKNYESRIHQNMERLFDLLAKKNKKATFFCLGWIAQKYPEIIRKIDSLGYEIGTHSNCHQLAYDQTRSEFSEDLKIAIQSVEDIIGKKIRAYRAPGFSLNRTSKWILEVLIENGIEIDCSIFPAHRGVGGFVGFENSFPSIISINGRHIKEFPINPRKIVGLNLPFSGGGYFRVLPFCIIKTLLSHSDYTMTYFHPRDFDRHQPIIKDLPLLRKFYSYYGLKYSFNKLEKLLDNFEFIDLDMADKLVEWDNVKRIEI